jgi:16S rRNA (cytosine967-C5)-methyltransferase
MRFMRIHRPMAEAAATILKAVFREHQVLDHELAAAFEANPKWGKRDRSFIAETVFEVARWRRALAFVADSEEITALCVACWRRMGCEIPDWWSYRGADVGDMAAREEGLEGQTRAVRVSIPDWLDALGESELGAAWEGEIHALNERAPVFLRVNTLRTDVSGAIAWLAEHQVVATVVPGVPHALCLAPGKALPKPLRLDGRVEIQDAGSQLIAPLLDPQPGERVIDACSGAGGKSLHLAALMGDKGRVFAMDVAVKKLEELKRRAKRANASCISPKPITEATAADFENVADRLLIDAPCSGLGTLKRQPDLKWRIKPAQIERVRGIQAELLGSYPQMLKPGGRLVYATCSILPSENRAQIERLLDSGKFTLVSECPVSPAGSGFDGFYAAALQKC